MDSGLTPSTMNRAAFLARFAHVCEHAPWIAERTWDRGLGTAGDTTDGLADAFAATIAGATREEQMSFVCGHPDLAGKLALAGDMTDDSVSEQSSAGLDRCTPDELARFQTLNDTYRQKFGFPFILAVRGLDRQTILERFAARVENDPETEFREALTQISRIVRMRISLVLG